MERGSQAFDTGQREPLYMVVVDVSSGPARSAALHELTVQQLGIEVDDALQIAEHSDL